MESELNRRRGRTDATSEKLERLHHYFDKRRKARREDLYMGRPARLAGGRRKGILSAAIGSMSSMSLYAPAMSAHNPSATFC